MPGPSIWRIPPRLAADSVREVDEPGSDVFRLVRGHIAPTPSAAPAARPGLGRQPCRPGLLEAVTAPATVAEDIAQEAMLAAFRRWGHVRELGHPEAWVRRVCANMAISQFRRRLAELRARRARRRIGRTVVAAVAVAGVVLGVLAAWQRHDVVPAGPAPTAETLVVQSTGGPGVLGGTWIGLTGPGAGWLRRDGVLP